MKILFLVIKTEGEATNLQANIRDVNSWPAIAEIGWCLWSDQNEEVVELRAALEVGEAQLLEDLIDVLEDCDLLVTHDIALDNRILTAAMIRQGKKLTAQVWKRGTKYQGRFYEACPANFWDYRWPSLSWLYEELFETPKETGNNVCSDALVLKDCFLEMKNRGVLN